MRIVYERQKSSLLPVSKKYKFARIKKSVMVDSGTRQTGLVYESDSAFRAALSELEQLKSDQQEHQGLAQMISEEIRLLEEDTALHMACIKSLVSKI